MSMEMLGIIAGIIGLAGYIPYIISIIKGETKPNKASWFIWTVVGGLLAFSYAAEGDINAIWVPIGYFVGPLIVAILSLKYGYSTWSMVDKICIVIAVISIIPWWLSHDATITLLINLIIDFMGAIPTVIKTYREPETEDFLAWTMFFIANTLLIIVVDVWNVSALYPVYLFFLAGTIFVLTLMDKLKKKLR
jgi:hypothetical protein